jgi:5-methylcytosine-specific restriction protein A
MLQDLFKEVLTSFLRVKEEPFAGHSFQNVLRKQLPVALKQRLELEDRYKVKGSPGLTQWTHVPWAAILDDLVTDTPQRGYYPTLLFKADMSGLYLTLNQGITDVRKLYKSGAAEVLRTRARDFLNRIGTPPDGFQTGEIRLEAPSGSDPSYYDYGNIIAKFYPAESFPSDESLVADIRKVISIYSSLVEVDDTDSSDSDSVPKGPALFEDTTKWRYHRRIERNQSISRHVKSVRGYKCEACGLHFEERYGDIGRKFIEAHHLTPLSQLNGRVKLDAHTDFVVLCANCHRMIHRQDDPSDLESLRQRIKCS